MWKQAPQHDWRMDSSQEDFTLGEFIPIPGMTRCGWKGDWTYCAPLPGLPISFRRPANPIENVPNNAMTNFNPYSNMWNLDSTSLSKNSIPGTGADAQILAKPKPEESRDTGFFKSTNRGRGETGAEPSTASPEAPKKIHGRIVNIKNKVTAGGEDASEPCPPSKRAKKSRESKASSNSRRPSRVPSKKERNRRRTSHSRNERKRRRSPKRQSSSNSSARSRSARNRRRSPSQQRQRQGRSRRRR